MNPRQHPRDGEPKPWPPALRSRLKRLARRAVIACGLLLLVAQWLFPGGRMILAFQIGTGIGNGSLQARIDRIEEAAIDGAVLDDADRAFLVDFYRTLAAGARASILVGQTGRLMDHYLDGSGADFRLEPEIFTENARVREEIEKLRARAARVPCDGAHTVESWPFYMPHRSKIDSVFGLYHGQVKLTPTPTDQGCVAMVRAEVPWVWPSYVRLEAQYGDPRAERFPLPNALVLVYGRARALYVGNGLGHHLETLGLARSFLAYSEWAGPRLP